MAPIVATAFAWSVPCASFGADPADARPTGQLQAGWPRELLDNGYDDWSSAYLSSERRSDASALSGGARRTERHGLKDEEGRIGFVIPLGKRSSVGIEAGFSGTRNVLPSRYGALQLEHRPAPGWSVAAALRHSEYRVGSSDLVGIAAERHLGTEHFAYTLYAGRPSGGAVGVAHRWQWSHYYGDREWLGVSIAHGKETEHAPGGFLASDVRVLALAGRHQMARQWALTWEAGVHRQGELDRRHGFRLGLAREF